MHLVHKSNAITTGQRGSGAGKSSGIDRSEGTRHTWVYAIIMFVIFETCPLIKRNGCSLALTG
jgi:hypothetical protein